MSEPSSPRSRFAPYKAALNALSTRTQTPLPSLIASFAVLHELTAIVPLVSLFFAARALGVGEQTVALVRSGITTDPSQERSWAREKSMQWIDDGEQWAARVGRRYGIFGYTKRDKNDGTNADAHSVSQGLASDVANAAFAYGVTKALLPARIALSMYFAPAFSRRLVEPFRLQITRIWRR